MRKILCLCVALALCTTVYAQNVTINPGGITPALAYPRISYDAILALPNPQEGDLAFDTTNKCLRVYIDGKWLCSFQDPKAYISSLSLLISAGGTGSDLGQDIAVDNNGNIYVTGGYTGTTKFDATTKTSAGSVDIFVAKFNSSGALQWLQSAGGEGEDLAESVAVDANGNVYITGYYHTDATFGETILSGQGGKEAFVAKYTSAGALDWVRVGTGELDDEGTGVAVDGSGNVYVTGTYTDYAVFGNTPFNKTAEGENDIFIAKYNTSGAIQWLESAGGANQDKGQDITLDNSGYLYLTGYYTATATFGGTSKTAVGLTDVFLAKYNTSGSFQWVQSAGGSADDHGRGVAVNGTNVYITGDYYGTATFASTNISSAGGYDIFLAQYNTSGALQWAQSAGGTGFDGGFSVAANGSNVYLTGYFTGSATFGTTQLTGQAETIFIAKYNTSGVCQGAQAAGGPAQDFGLGVALDTTGKAYTTGYYAGTATFGSTTRTSQGLADVFVVRLD